MIFNTIAVALALSATASAAALQARQFPDPCRDALNACLAAGTPEVACNCAFSRCLGEDNARNRDFCASATAGLNLPTLTLIPSPPIWTPIPGIPGGCNPAHPGSCPPWYFSKTSGIPTPTPTPSEIPIPSPTDMPIPTTTPCPEDTPSVPTPAPNPPVYHDPVIIPGKTWTLANLTRYCGDGNVGCDYNFVLLVNGKTERCTVIRMPGRDAATESWYTQPCDTGSDTKISWGYEVDGVPPYAVITVVEGKELAWFGVPNVNGARVTPNAPFGSNNYGSLPASPVYTYN